MADTLARSTAIVVVHGVQPTPQYAFQDQVATALCTQLQNGGGSGAPWTVDVIEPKTPPVPPGKPPNPTVTRVHRADRTFVRPAAEYYDVIEAYWSPLDKVPLSFVAVLGWLLNTLLTPINSTAYLHGGKKTRFDAAFVAGAVTTAGVLLALTVWALYVALIAIALRSTGKALQPSPAAVFAAMHSVTALAHLVSWHALLLLLLGAGGLYLVSQAAITIGVVWRQWTALGLRPHQRSIRIFIAVVATVAGGAAIALAAWAPIVCAAPLGWPAVLFVLAAGFLTFARSVGELSVVNFFRDVDIYTNPRREPRVLRLARTDLGAGHRSASGKPRRPAPTAARRTIASSCSPTASARRSPWMR